MTQVGFIGGAYLNVQDSYADIVGRDWTQPFEVTLTDGMYGRTGDTMRAFLNPLGIAYVQDFSAADSEEKTA